MSRQQNETPGVVEFATQWQRAIAQLEMDLALAAGDEARARELTIAHFRGVQEACERIVHAPGLLITGRNGGKGRDARLRAYARRVHGRAAQALAELGAEGGS